VVEDPLLLGDLSLVQCNQFISIIDRIGREQKVCQFVGFIGTCHT